MKNLKLLEDFNENESLFSDDMNDVKKIITYFEELITVGVVDKVSTVKSIESNIGKLKDALAGLASQLSELDGADLLPEPTQADLPKPDDIIKLMKI